MPMSAIGTAWITGQQRGAVAAPRPAPRTIGALYLSAMREHDRACALLHRAGDRWEESPDWRVDRQVIRLGLYLRERAGVAPGERVAILSPLRREWLLAEWSACAQGAASVAIDPELPAPALADALAQVQPRAVFVADGAVLERVVAARGCADAEIIAFDGPVPGERATLFSEALDLGGTLDTPERAGAFRALARDVSPEARALGHVERGEGGVACRYLLQREVMARLGALGRGEPRRGSIAYVAAPAASPGVRLALLAFMGDGRTTAALGTPGREPEEIEELRPAELVAPPDVLAAALSRAAVPAAPAPWWRSWLERAARAAPVGRRAREGDRRHAGRRPRWLRGTAALDALALGASGPGAARAAADVVELGEGGAA
jgi:long-chain acyl-CoA synthetase